MLREGSSESLRPAASVVPLPLSECEDQLGYGVRTASRERKAAAPALASDYPVCVVVRHYFLGRLRRTCAGGDGHDGLRLSMIGALPRLAGLRTVWQSEGDREGLSRHDFGDAVHAEALCEKIVVRGFFLTETGGRTTPDNDLRGDAGSTLLAGCLA